jgi:hypothetical protein
MRPPQTLAPSRRRRQAKPARLGDHARDCKRVRAVRGGGGVGRSDMGPCIWARTGRDLPLVGKGL